MLKRLMVVVTAVVTLTAIALLFRALVSSSGELQFEPPPTLTVARSASAIVTSTAPATTTAPVSRRSARDLLRRAGCRDVTESRNTAYCTEAVADGTDVGVGSLVSEVFDSNHERDVELARWFTPDPNEPPRIPVLVGDRWIVIGEGLSAVQARIGGIVRTS
jgi:hypothetical protein